MDSIGPRLTGSPANRAANDWLVRTYTGVGHRREERAVRHLARLDARGEQRIDARLAARRARSRRRCIALERGDTGGRRHRRRRDHPARRRSRQRRLRALARRSEGKVRARVSMPQPTCRPDSDLKYWADSAGYQRRDGQRATASAARLGGARSRHRRQVNARRRCSRRSMAPASPACSRTAGRAAGASTRSSRRARQSVSRRSTLSCEDYGLLCRLADERAASARARRRRVDARAAASRRCSTPSRRSGAREKPNEYVMLSAHLDSWDGAQRRDGQRHRHDHHARGDAHPEAASIRSPKRTILVGHWSGEEEGEIGSRAFAADHPEVLRGCRRCSTRTTAPARSTPCRRTASSTRRHPRAVDVAACRRTSRDSITLMFPGVAHNESTDSDAFVCHARRRSSSTSSDWDVRRLHLAHQPRHVRQDHLRRCEAERDARRDVRVPGVGGSDARVANAARAADGSAHESADAPCRCAGNRRGAGRRHSGRRSRRGVCALSGLIVPSTHTTERDRCDVTPLRCCSPPLRSLSSRHPRQHRALATPSSRSR